MNETSLGAKVLDWCDQLALHSDQPDALTVAYLTPAHRAAAADIARWMTQAGMAVHADAVGNVVGRYLAKDESARTLLMGSHFDTVRNGGKYDGRLGILLPIAVIGEMQGRGERAPCHLEVVAFAEEEGLRFKSSFLGSSALTGEFDLALLDRVDADGVSMRKAMADASLPADAQAIEALARDPSKLAGYFEIHIEQGPVLLERGSALGVVTSIAGSVRMTAEVGGVASHSGTTPMNMRHDAATASAEMLLAVERRCSGIATLVGTVGMLVVPHGAANVVPGRCEFSLDVRAADDATRDAAVADIIGKWKAIAARRGVGLQLATHMRVPCAPCSPSMMALLGDCVERAGVKRFDLPSGAGHDAMMMQRLTDIAMLFVRCGNGGISHNPAETVDAADVELAGQVVLDFIRRVGP